MPLNCICNSADPFAWIHSGSVFGYCGTRQWCEAKSLFSDTHTHRRAIRLNELGHGGSRDRKRGWDVQKWRHLWAPPAFDGVYFGDLSSWIFLGNGPWGNCIPVQNTAVCTTVYIQSAAVHQCKMYIYTCAPKSKPSLLSIDEPVFCFSFTSFLCLEIRIKII